jgi:AcrR family transcriptional regulator
MVYTMSRKNLDTREKILQASAELLVDQQGNGVRMGDIAKRTGVSRQAVYLHFATRTELLIATTKFIDEQLQVDKRLEPSRQAKIGSERLNLYIEAWGNYIPEIYGVAKALMNAQDSDEAADAAWKERMEAMKDGCRAAIEALHKDGNLSPDLKPKEAIELLWAMLSVRNWESLVQECGWSNKKYVDRLKLMAKKTFVV